MMLNHWKITPKRIVNVDTGVVYQVKSKKGQLILKKRLEELIEAINVISV